MENLSYSAEVVTQTNLVSNLPGFLSWFGVEQILWVCSNVMNFIYHNIASNVGWAIILYALFSHILFLPFSIKNGVDKKRNEKVNKEVALLYEEFNRLPEEERDKEDVKELFRERKREILKKKSSTGLGCLLIFIRLFILISAMPVINYIDVFIGPSPEAYYFFGFNLQEIPFGQLSLSLIFPFLTAFILTFSGFLSTRKNLKMQKEMNDKKTEGEREDEKRMLEEMGVKESKIPMGYIIQLAFGLLYFYTFSNLKLALSLYWVVYYLTNIGVKWLIDFTLSKIPNKKSSLAV